MDLSFIKKVRKEKDLSIKELANLTKITPNRLSKIENNKTNPRLDDIEKILSVLDYSMIARDKMPLFLQKEFICINENKK